MKVHEIIAQFTSVYETVPTFVDNSFMNIGAAVKQIILIGF